MNKPPEKPDKRRAGMRGVDKSADAKLSDRLDSLGDRLSKHKQVIEKEEEKQASSRSEGIGQAMKLSSEFIAAICVGAGIGYLIDSLAGSSPWGMIVFLFLGFGAGVLNALRAAGMIAETNLHFGATIEPKNDE